MGATLVYITRLEVQMQIELSENILIPFKMYFLLFYYFYFYLYYYLFYLIIFYFCLVLFISSFPALEKHPWVAIGSCKVSEQHREASIKYEWLRNRCRLDRKSLRQHPYDSARFRWNWACREELNHRSRILSASRVDISSLERIRIQNRIFFLSGDTLLFRNLRIDITTCLTNVRTSLCKC